MNIVTIVALISPVILFLIIKITDLIAYHKNKRWSDEDADVVDNWKFPSNTNPHK